MNDLKKLAQQVGTIAQAAGDQLLTFWRKPIEIEQKPQAGIVTQADIASENFIIQELQKVEPGIAFWAEERGNLSQGASWCWVIDPLDGTTNFSRHIPYFCISIALIHNGEPQLGVIYQPVTRELFVAYKNGGALYNGTRMIVSCRARQDYTIAVSFPYIETPYGWCDPNIATIWPDVFEVRYIGAAALDLAYTAAGRFDAAFFRRIAWWDIAAGVILIQEAGGVATEFDGSPLTSDYQSLVAGGPGAVTWLQSKLKL